MKPHTYYEIASTMRVRECRQTAIVWPRKYYDIDLCAFDSDRIETINHDGFSLSELMESCDGHHYGEPLPVTAHQEGSSIYNIPKFTPKDNDFDDECRRDEKRKEQILIESQKEKERFEQEEIEYQARVKQRELEILTIEEQKRNIDDRLRIIGNVRPNTWKVKSLKG